MTEPLSPVQAEAQREQANAGFRPPEVGETSRIVGTNIVFGPGGRQEGVANAAGVPAHVPPQNIARYEVQYAPERRPAEQVTVDGHPAPSTLLYTSQKGWNTSRAQGETVTEPAPVGTKQCLRVTCPDAPTWNYKCSCVLVDDIEGEPTPEQIKAVLGLVYHTVAGMEGTKEQDGTGCPEHGKEPAAPSGLDIILPAIAPQIPQLLAEAVPAEEPAPEPDPTPSEEEPSAVPDETESGGDQSA